MHKLPLVEINMHNPYKILFRLKYVKRNVWRPSFCLQMIKAVHF